jgi:6-phosphofructokinase 1
MCATYTYGVRAGGVRGVLNGYRGFYDESVAWVPLTPASVSRIHLAGGTVLGSSRGGFDARRILAALARERVDIVVLIGGDGTHRGAAALAAAARAAGMRLSVACVPKTVDNDLPVIDGSFGFATAVEQAVRPIDCAHTEAHSATQGVGVVKLMGRSAGFLAMHASLASRDVNACLLPEAPWRLAALCGWLEERLARAGHAVVVVAEGAQSAERAAEAAAAAAAPGAPPAATDASGNAVLDDVGEYVRAGIVAHFKAAGKTVNVKYIDPSYVIRAAPANAADSMLCTQLAFNTIHGALAGLAAFSVGTVDGAGVWLPVGAIAGPPRRVDTASRLFARLIASTGQPDFS